MHQLTSILLFHDALTTTSISKKVLFTNSEWLGNALLLTKTYSLQLHVRKRTRQQGTGPKQLMFEKSCCQNLIEKQAGVALL